MGERLEFLNDDIQGFYTPCRVSNRLPRLKRSNLKDGDYPELKGNGVKAANTRALLPFLCDLQTRATARTDTPKNRQMLQVVQSLQHAYDVMYAIGPILTRAAWLDLQAALTTFAQSYQLLSVMSWDEGKLRWSCTPKLHYVGATWQIRPSSSTLCTHRGIPQSRWSGYCVKYMSTPSRVLSMPPFRGLPWISTVPPCSCVGSDKRHWTTFTPPLAHL